MGSGKTSWAIQHINESPDDNFLYITPFLTEVDRIIENTSRPFRQPLNKGKGKLFAVNNLLGRQEDIAATHELFKWFDENSKEEIQNGNYTLILDEVLGVLDPLPYKQGDIKILLESDSIRIDEDKYVHWNPNKHEYDTIFADLRRLAEKHMVVCVNETILLWKYPPEIFTLFSKVYVLTYLFDASILKYYFDLHNIEYEKRGLICSENKYYITNYEKPDVSVFKDKIHIYEGSLNSNFYHKNVSLSKSWFEYRESNEDIAVLRNNLYNYFRNVINAKSSEIIWTTFKDSVNKLKGKGYSSKFVPFNCRSTNEFKNAKALGYCLNVFLHPGITSYFSPVGVKVDQELYALSEMLQWIWRSNIRDGGEIYIYIPSKRMRKLLTDWLNNLIG